MHPAVQWPPVTNTQGILRSLSGRALLNYNSILSFPYETRRTLWHKAEPMANARAKMAYFSDGQRMYVAGGLGASGSPIDSLEMYEIGTWTARKRLPSATSG